MGKNYGVGAAAAALILCALASSARATCIEFRESTGGDAMLINHCNVEMNVGYFVGAANAMMDLGGKLYRSTVSPEATRVLWTRDRGPVSGRYQVKVFSCMAPTDLVYTLGGQATCQISYASEG